MLAASKQNFPRVFFFFYSKLALKLKSEHLETYDDAMAVGHVRKTQVGGEPILLNRREKREDNFQTRNRDFSSLLQY